jgi:hypothetical protein
MARLPLLHQIVHVIPVSRFPFHPEARSAEERAEKEEGLCRPAGGRTVVLREVVGEGVEVVSREPLPVPLGDQPAGVDDPTSGIVEQLQPLPDDPQAEVGLLEIEKVLP